MRSLFIDNIWGADLAGMQMIRKVNRGFIFLLCVIDIYSKYVWVIPVKDKKRITITNVFQKFLDESNCKPNKMGLGKGSKFYNRSRKIIARKNWCKMCSIQNEGKSIIGKRFIRALKNTICKYMTSISKDVYIDKLDNIIDKYNNTYHSTIKMKPIDVKSSMI